MRKKLCALLLASIIACAVCGAAMGETYYYPSEGSSHEGTWLIWPHNYGLPDTLSGTTEAQSYRDSLEVVWIEMTEALHTGETVHIIAYNESEKARIQALLEAEHIDMRSIDFFICPSNDVWARDTGPIFVLGEDGRPVIANFVFDGWGRKQEASLDNAIPQAVADAYNVPIVQIPELVLEGGAVECDGAGTLMAAKSSVVSSNRNADKTLEEVEAILAKYLGVTNFIWIEGAVGKDITDAHIDGIARFISDRRIITCSEDEFIKIYMLYTGDPDTSDWTTITNSKNAKGEPYEIVYLPWTQNMVISYGEGMGIYGNYVNYYVGNEVVLVPQYGDPNDAAALEIIGGCYPDRRTVGINCINMLEFGGMIHCVTQQQPAS